MLEPNIKQMLEMGEGCGLKTLEEAYNNYLNHYDMFFTISEYANQLNEFNKKLLKKGLVYVHHDRNHLHDLTIKEALKLCS